MYTLVAGRAGGKTTIALNWLMDGQKVDGYPGWDRVLIVHNLQNAHQLRKRAEETLKMEDSAHRIYSIGEWLGIKSRGSDYKTEVVIDNADLVLKQMFMNKIHGITLTGETWPNL